MTIETAKRLYQHYISIDRKDLAEDIAKNRPEVKEPEKKEKKSKK